LGRRFVADMLGAGLSVLTLETFDEFWFLAAGVPATFALAIPVRVLGRRARNGVMFERSSPEVRAESR